MHSTKLLSRLALATALTAAAAASQAALTVYTSSASFAAATTAASTDTFNDVALDAITSPLVRVVGSYGYTASSSPDLFGSGTLADSWLSTQQSGVPLLIGSIIGPVNAIGGLFFGSDGGLAFQSGQTLTVTVVDSLGGTSSRVISNASTTSFVGFVSSALITSLSVSIANAESFATVNDLVLAQVPAVPEPATVGMLLAGLGALAFVRRRRGA